jgi:hypothetical protein
LAAISPVVMVSVTVSHCRRLHSTAIAGMMMNIAVYCFRWPATATAPEAAEAARDAVDHVIAPRYAHHRSARAKRQSGGNDKNWGTVNQKIFLGW